MNEDSGFPDPAGFTGESDYPDFHRSTRMPLDAVVRLHFEGTVAYQNGFAANVSATGMYVKHPDPPPVGTRLVFELVLGEERKPVQGAGVVAWAREKYEGPGRPAGIGIQFTEIDALSRQHVAEALFAYLETQLGDELAESQDVVDLVATTSTRTPIELVESFGRSTGEEVVEPSLPLSPSQPISLYEADETELTRKIVIPPSPRPEVAAELLGTAEGGLFTPAIPPDVVPAPRSARARPKSAWPAIVIGVAIAAAAFAGWWFTAGPGSVDEIGPIATAPESPGQGAPDVAGAQPEREPLSATPGTDTTLAQAVGADAVDAPGPLPVGGEQAPAPEPGATNAASPDETGVEPPAAAEAAPSPAPAPAAEQEPAAPLAPFPNAVAATPAEPAASRATRVASIEWQEASGSTTVVLTGDGDFPAGSYKWNEIRGENPRVLLRFVPVTSGFSKTLLAAGTPELKQVRVGFHEKPAGNELHVVLDLAAPAVRVESVGAEGGRVVVRLVTR